MTSVEVRPGVEIAYERVGSGPSMLLVHGITESRRTWDPLIERLGTAFDLIAVDLRGHGESSTVAPFDAATLAEDLAILIGQLGLDRPFLVGHSLGGVVVSVLAGIVDTAGVVDVDQPLALAGFKAALAPAAPMIRGTDEQFRGFVAAMFASMDGPLPATERTRIDAHSRPDQQVVTSVWATVIDDTEDQLDAYSGSVLDQITAPYLSLHGIDPGPAYVEWLAARCPTATVEVWTGSGHYPHLVDPERFVARLVAFGAEATSSGR